MKGSLRYNVKTVFFLSKCIILIKKKNSYDPDRVRGSEWVKDQEVYTHTVAKKGFRKEKFKYKIIRWSGLYMYKPDD